MAERGGQRDGATVDVAGGSARRWTLGSAGAYGIAITSAAVLGLVVSGPLAAHGDRAPLVACLAAITLTAWLGGFWPALLATALDTVALAIHPSLGGAPVRPADPVLLGLFDGAGVLIAAFAARPRAPRRPQADRGAPAAAPAQLARCAGIETMLAHAPVGLAFFDRDRCFTWVNEPLAEIHGVSAEAHLGRAIRDVIPVIAISVDPVLRQVLDSGEAVQGLEVTGETPARPGEQRSFLASFYPVRAASGEVVSVGSLVMDVTDRKHADEAVRESEAKFRAVFDSDMVPLVIWHVDGRVVDANDAYLRLFGFSREELQRGEVWWTEVTPPEHRRDEVILAELASMGRYTPKELECIRRDGRRIPVLIGGSALAGHPDLGVSFVIDLSDKKSAETALAEQLAVTRAITDNATAALFMMDERGHATFMNPAAEAMTGYTLDEIRDRPLHDVIHHHCPDGRPYPASECPITRAVRDGRPLSAYDDAYLRKDGRAIAVVCATRPVAREGRPVSFVLEARDVTVQRRIEREREILLESERAARAEAERASRSKDEFVATLSHELRSPLNAVVGWTQILSRPSRTPEQTDKGLDTIARNARTLAQLISDLLDVSRIATGKLRLDPMPVDLPVVVDAALEGVRASAAAKGVAIRTSLAPAFGVVMGDAGRLQQVVWNLVSNAVKFTPRGGRVDVTLGRARDDVEITVADTGVGIDPAFLPHMFERFRQADSSTARLHGGLGLGLSIVKHLVELHGGTVRAESAGLGRGARFVVELPVQAATTTERTERRLGRGQHPCEMPRLVGKTVLVVDDEPDARELVQRMLEECEARVVTAASAPEALEALDRERPDVLVSDIGMPGQDGYALIREIRAGAVPETRDVPAVALTAFARPEDRQRALEAGYQAHIAKPVDAPELVTIASSLVSRRGGAPREAR